MSTEEKKKVSKNAPVIILSIILALILLVSVSGIILIKSFLSWPHQEGVSNDDTIVQTVNGKLQGRINNEVYNFLGVKYATAEKLFQPAQKVENWEGIKTAYKYGPASLQSNLLGDFGSWLAGTDFSNDCQNLNVWTPKINTSEKMPVMVWLHGGGFSSGTANANSGENLAKTQNVVVVGVNHRLNMLGHFNLSNYGEEYKDSANLGVDDIILSLEWIHENIEAFGGDPNNVTVFGQSGGGAKILALMTAPKAKGLFHKAIIQSGATETVGVKFTNKEVSLDLTEDILSQLKITKDNIEEINKFSYSRLMSAGASALNKMANKYKIPGLLNGYVMEWEPVVDGEYIVSHPVTENGFADVAHDIPILIGSNLHEWTYIASEQIDVTHEISVEFANAYPNESINSAYLTDTIMRMSALKIMSNKAEQGGANVYSYLFAYGNANHGDEVPYVFANGEGEMHNLMSSIWANFAKNGVPSAEGLPTWEAYTKQSGACMILDKEFYLDYHHDKDLLALLEPQFNYPYAEI